MENKRCHRPEARVSDVQERANRSKESDAGNAKKELEGELWELCLCRSIVSVGIHRGVTPGGKRCSVLSPLLDGEKNVKSTWRNVGNADANKGAVVSAHSTNSSSETAVSMVDDFTFVVVVVG